MTGGSLPAMAFKDIMLFAHRDVELRPIPGLEEGGALLAGGAPETTASVDPQVLALQRNALSRRSFEAVTGIGSLFEDVRTPSRGFRGASGAGDRRRLAEPGPAAGFRSVTR